MQNRTLPAAVVGAVAGLIIGFFLGMYQGKQSAPPAAAPAGSQSVAGGGLPENHPSQEIMDNVARLREQAQKNPNDTNSRIELGNIFYDLGQHEQAIGWYAQVLEIDPKNVNVRTDMGTAYHFLGNHDRALQEFAISLSIDPKHPQTLQNMGWVKYNGKKDYQGALDAWNTLLKTNPNYQNAEQVRKQIEQATAEMAGKKG